MWLALMAVLVASLVLAEIGRRRNPRTNRIVNTIAWSIEGGIIALTIVGLLYQCTTGKLL